MPSSEFKIGDVVQSGDESIYIIRRISDGRADLDTVIETYPRWLRHKNKNLPFSVLIKITHAEGLNDD